MQQRKGIIIFGCGVELSTCNIKLRLFPYVSENYVSLCLDLRRTGKGDKKKERIMYEESEVKFSKFGPCIVSPIYSEDKNVYSLECGNTNPEDR